MTAMTNIVITSQMEPWTSTWVMLIMAFWNAPLDDAQHAKNAVTNSIKDAGSV
jgi:hypothetical protein